MPGGDRSLTIAYAGAASLAAITLVYVFGPSFFLDTTNTTSTQRRNGVVGLVNPANDCFINSVLQALAGLPELREYLAHRTRIANNRAVISGSEKEVEGQPLLLSTALKSILDSLNEKPLQRKAISARPFVLALEQIFRQKISRAQQDAQEFLQVVAERLAEEYHAMEKPLRQSPAPALTLSNTETAVLFSGDPEKEHMEQKLKVDPSIEYFENRGMPLEGAVESEIECQKCRYKTSPNRSKFVVLTLPVPVKSSAALSECFDGLLTTEFIDDYQCEKCHVVHAITHYERKLQNNPPAHISEEIQANLVRLRQSLATSPLVVPPDITMPPGPQCRIAKRTRISTFPSVIVIHLSRSIYDLQTSSRKNSCKVSFPELLTLGGLLDRKRYKLLCAVIHKGGHDSGHYECFRRQIVYAPPYSTPHPPPTANSSSDSSPTISVAPSVPITPPSDTEDGDSSVLENSSTKSQQSTSLSPSPASHTPFGNHRSSSPSSQKTSPSASTPTIEDPQIPSPSPPSHPTVSAPTKTKITPLAGGKKKPKKNNKWWRISDDKIRETKTDDVLTHQKEVYLLFYEKLKSETD
ncbi:U1biquitin-specific peptidase-like protein [Peziza echinospora]|nr:U1biquitin-specific peptidase-like protein [Peziza echinospora]